MADRIVLNTISYHGHGAIENIVPELTARGYKKAFVCSDPDLIKFGVTGKITALLDFAVNSIGEAGCIQQGSDLAGAVLKQQGGNCAVLP